MMKTRLKGFAGVLLAAGCWLWMAGAQAALPIERWQDVSGAQVSFVRSDALPMVDLQIDVDGGSRRDPAEKAGLAAATAALMDSGVQAWGDRPALDENALAEAWLDLGAQFHVNAGLDRLSFSLRSLTEPEVLAKALDLAAQQLAAPRFDSAIWGRERERWSAAWQEAQTRPDTHAQRRFEQAVYGGHPYGLEATPQTLARISDEDLRGFYRQHARACDARVTVVGRLDRVDAQQMVARLLAAWRSNGCQSLPPVEGVVPLKAPVRVDLPFAAAQAQILVGQPGIARSDPDFFALTVGNHILGGSGFTSRLMQEIREKRGLTYGVYSYFAPGRHEGAFTIGMQTRPDRAKEALALIDQTLKRFVDEGPTAAELEQAKASLINGFALRIDSNRKILDNVANMGWNDLPLDYLETWTRKVRAVSREEIVQAFRRVIHPERMVTVVVGGPQ